MAGYILQERGGKNAGWVPDLDSDADSDSSDDEMSGGNRYFYPSINSSILDEATLVGTLEDHNELLDKLRNVDTEATLTQTQFVCFYSHTCAPLK